jgi:hypothetical protein
MAIPLKISDMPVLTAAVIAAGDEFEVRDISEPDATANTRLTLAELRKAIGIYTGFPISMGNSGNSTNSYLNTPGGVPSSTSGIILPWDATLIGLSLATTGAQTWTAEVHLGLSLVAGAILASGGARAASTAALSINFSAGDELQFYVNGTAINNPVMTGYFARRD